MNEKNILVVLPVEERHRRMLEEAFPGGNFIYKKVAGVGSLSGIHILIGNVPAGLLSTADRLEWMQLNSAGADAYIKEGVLKAGTLLTNATGAYGLAISEHLLAGTFSLLKRLNQYVINQTKHLWQDEGPVTSVYGARTLIIGLGNIGSEYGRRMKALGSTVVGIKRHADRRPEWLDGLFPMEALNEELGKADIVAMALPDTPETRHLIGIDRLRLMKKSAILLNIGRGNAIVSEDLCTALEENLIFGAFLDVTDPEPLPPGHPLWSAGNIIITPHISGQYHLQETFERIVRIACENLRHFSVGETLCNLVDFKTGYRRHE